MWLHGFFSISSLLPLCCYNCCYAALTSGSVSGGGLGAGGYLDRCRGKVREHRILSLHVNRKVGGLWRADRAGLGGALLQGILFPAPFTCAVKS